MERTPDEIKKGMECDDCKSCPYGERNNNDGDNHCGEVEGDALALIQQLQDENAKKDETIQMLQDGNASLMRMIDEECEKTVKLEAERDAAVETIYEMAKCITDDVCEWCDQTECERLCMMHATERPGFKWRGIQKEGE